MKMKLYYWSSVIAILLNLSFNVSADTDNESGSEKSDRQIRQVPYRGNQRYQVPEYLRHSLSPDAYAQTIYSTDHRGADGSFGYEYQTENGIKAKQESTGYGPNKVVRGYYSYIGPDGKQYTVNYIADRFGYRAYGDHLPGQPNYSYDPTSFPIYPTPPRPAPLNLLNQQHHTQTAFIPTETLQSQNIYVADTSQPNYVNITPKPFISGAQQLAVLQPQTNYVAPSPYNQIAWTTQRPYVSFS